MKTNQASYTASLHPRSCAREADTDFDLDTEIAHGPARQPRCSTTDETVLIEDLIDALHEKERMIEELKQHQAAGWSAPMLAAWRRRFAALVVSSARPTAAR